MAGQRIDDHASWIGAAPRGEVFPKGVKTKSYESASGDGGITDYPDTSELIKRDQDGAIRKSKSQKTEPGYRF